MNPNKSKRKSFEHSFILIFFSVHNSALNFRFFKSTQPKKEMSNDDYVDFFLNLT